MEKPVTAEPRSTAPAPAGEEEGEEEGRGCAEVSPAAGPNGGNALGRMACGEMGLVLGGRGLRREGAGSGPGGGSIDSSQC